MSKAKSTFEGLFDKQRLNEMPRAVERNEGTPQPASEAPRIGRPRAGKRSNAEYKQFSVLLKKATHKQVSHLLDDIEPKQDVSELVQQLLEDWIEERKR